MVAACGNGENNESAEAENTSNNEANEQTEDSEDNAALNEETNEPATNEENSEEDTEEPATENEEATNNNAEEEEAAEEIAEDGWDTEVGDTIENEGGTFTLHARQDDIETVETGPVVMEIEQVNAASGELAPDLVEMMETENLEYVQIDLQVENTGDEDITFYASQATIATSTGEQLEPDMWLSDHIDGEMMSGTSHSGSFFFVLENSNAEDVESVRITWSAPSNEDWEDIGEEVDIEVEL